MHPAIPFCLGALCLLILCAVINLIQSHNAHQDREERLFLTFCAHLKDEARKRHEYEKMLKQQKKKTKTPSLN